MPLYEFSVSVHLRSGVEPDLPWFPPGLQPLHLPPRVTRERAAGLEPAYLGWRPSACNLSATPASVFHLRSDGIRTRTPVRATGFVPAASTFADDKVIVLSPQRNGYLTGAETGDRTRDSSLPKRCVTTSTISACAFTYMGLEPTPRMGGRYGRYRLGWSQGDLSRGRLPFRHWELRPRSRLLTESRVGVEPT
jgi:hypothetical protein